MAQSWYIDPVTKDYVMSGGAPEVTDSLLIPAYIRLKTRQSQWMYAPNTQYGSTFYTVRKNRTTSDTTRLEKIAAVALQPLVDDGRSEQVTVETVEVVRHGVALKATVTSAETQEPEAMIIPLREG